MSLKSHENPRIVLPVLSALVLVIGYLHSGRQSLSLDEAVGLRHALQAFSIDPWILLRDIHTPLYNVLAAAWLGLGGFEPGTARGLSLLAAAALPWAVFRLATRFLDRRTGLHAAALAAFSPLVAFYSQNARSYMLLVLLATLSSHAYLAWERASRSCWDRRTSVAWLAGAFAMVASHLVGFAVIAAQGVHLVATAVRARDWARAVRWMVLQVVLLVLYAPVLRAILSHFDLRRDIPQIYSWVPVPGWRSLLDAAVFLSGSSTFLAAGLLALVAVFFVRRLRPRDDGAGAADRSVVFYLVCWALLPALLLLAYSFLHHPVFILRGLLPSAIPLLVLAAAGLAGWKAPRPVRLGAFGLIAALSLHQTVSAARVDQENWRGVASWLREESARNGRGWIVLRPDFASYPFSYYWNRKCFEALDSPECLRGDRVLALPLEGDLGEALVPGSRLLFVGYNSHSRSNAELVEGLAKSGRARILSSSELPPSFHLWVLEVMAL